MSSETTHIDFLPLSPYSYLTARPSSQSKASCLSWTPNGQLTSCRYWTQETNAFKRLESAPKHVFVHTDGHAGWCQVLFSPSGRLWASLSWGCSSGFLCPRSCSVWSSGPPATRCSSWTVSRLRTNAESQSRTKVAQWSQVNEWTQASGNSLHWQCGLASKFVLWNG